ncbi:hypothetical protein I552_3956 [Mycobacterium xenopi 3993]|nr:hypothetical protein I552_3956 [Mycobacterium xenopi 3993]
MARITDHRPQRQGRFVLRSLNCVVATIPVPAAAATARDHHPPGVTAPPTRPHRTGT